MKIRCQCGFVILDGTDELPQKAHLLPDQEWLTAFDRLEGIVTAVARGELGAELACQRVTEVVCTPARLMWQCRSCGRLYVDGHDRQLHCFTPEGTAFDRELLRGAPKNADS